MSTATTPALPPFTTGPNGSATRRSAYDKAVLLRTCLHLGACRSGDDQSEFVSTLLALGMDETEALRYWGACYKRPDGPGPHEGAKNNTVLTSALGIQMNDPNLARNQLLYRVLHLLHPDLFNVDIREGPHVGGKANRETPDVRRVHITKHPIGFGGNPMKVCELFDGVQPAEFEAIVLQKSKPLCDALGVELGNRLGQLLLRLEMLVPPTAVCRLLGDVLSRGTSGEEIVIAGAYCPDYAYEKTDNPALPYRYTFDGVGSGVGLVAQQFVRVIPHLAGFLTDIGVKHRIVLAIGDFEADSDDVLRRVGVDRAEFHRRCDLSNREVAKVLSGVPNLTLEMFARDRGNGRFRPLSDATFARMKESDFGCIPELYPDFAKIVGRVGKDYGTFYSRWYGKEMDEREVFEIVCRQGAEYAAMGKLLMDDFGENLVILSGDRPQMHLFDAYYGQAPVLCVKRAY